MNIKHIPVVKDTDKVAKRYSDKDGVPVKYVCTTDITQSDSPIDVFYRDTPHPQFGNKYFGILFRGQQGYITDADAVEGLVICCVEDDEGQLQYSQSHHDYKHFDNGNMIDGGRVYNRYSGKPQYFEVKNGELVVFVPERLKEKTD